ncbi:MAG: hypothetical protein ACLPY5_12120 [Candidatus Bathyarchaeia archaeon]
MTEAVLAPKGNHIDLTCGICGHVVYSTNNPAYDPVALRAAVDQHRSVCVAKKEILVTEHQPESQSVDAKVT